MLDKTFIEKLFTQWDLIFQANIETLTELDSVGGDGGLRLPINLFMTAWRLI